MRGKRAVMLAVAVATPQSIEPVFIVLAILGTAVLMYVLHKLLEDEERPANFDWLNNQNQQVEDEDDLKQQGTQNPSEEIGGT